MYQKYANLAALKIAVGEIRGLKLSSTKMGRSCFIINKELKKAHKSKKYFKIRIIIMQAIFGIST